MKQAQQNKHKDKRRSVILMVALLLCLILLLTFSSLKYKKFFNRSTLQHLPQSTTQTTINSNKEYPDQSTSQTIEKQSSSDIYHQSKVKPTFQSMLAAQAELRLQSEVSYNGRYEKIAYPMGDVPANIGVCTDVVIRSYRGLGIDLQQRVHEDMKANFRAYPSKWRLRQPDTNIDHRRVPNLMTYFKRKGAALPISENPYDYKQGHLVTWDLGKGLVHIGIVSEKLSMITGHPLIIHNIGAGPEMSDILFRYKITGHYQYGADTFQN